MLLDFTLLSSFFTIGEAKHLSQIELQDNIAMCEVYNPTQYCVVKKNY